MTATHIYLIQHGLALSKEKDPERPLSARGLQQTHTVASQFEATGLPLTAVFHSGKLRAQQTAHIFADRFKLPEAAMEGMGPNDPVAELIPHLQVEHALYVGHLPQLQKLTDTLLTGRDDSRILLFRNSALVSLEKDGNPGSDAITGCYQLALYLPPAFG